MAGSELSQEAISRGLNTRVVGLKVLYLVQTTSTMDVARREADAGAPEGLVVVAEEQTAGRGRFDRQWVSPPGVNIYFSILLRPQPDQLHQMNMAATLAVVRAIRAVARLQPTVKWPNDVRLNGRKACGILVEGRSQGEGVGYAIVGIGINVNLDPIPYPEIAELATSLAREAGVPISRLAILQTLLRELDSLYTDLQRQDESLWREWRGLLETLGQRVRVKWVGQVEEGLVVDVDLDGGLVLERGDGSQVTLPAGEVTLQVE